MVAPPLLDTTLVPDSLVVVMEVFLLVAKEVAMLPMEVHGGSHVVGWQELGLSQPRDQRRTQHPSTTRCYGAGCCRKTVARDVAVAA